MGNCFPTKQNLLQNELDDNKPKKLPQPSKDPEFESEFEGKLLFELVEPKLLDQFFDRIEEETDFCGDIKSQHQAKLDSLGFAWELYMRAHEVSKGKESQSYHDVGLGVDTFFNPDFVALHWMNIDLASVQKLYPGTESFTIEDSEFNPNACTIMRVELARKSEGGSLKIKAFRRHGGTGEIQMITLPVSSTNIAKQAKYEKLQEELETEDKMRWGNLRTVESGRIFMFMSRKADSDADPQLAIENYKRMGEFYLNALCDLMFDFAFREEGSKDLKWFTDDEEEIERILQSQREAINKRVLAGGEGMTTDQVKTVLKVFPSVETGGIEVEEQIVMGGNFEREAPVIEEIKTAGPQETIEEKEQEIEAQLGTVNKENLELPNQKALEEEQESEGEALVTEEIVVVASRNDSEEELEEPEEESLIGGQHKVPVAMKTVEIETQEKESEKVGETKEGNVNLSEEKEETDDENETNVEQVEKKVEIKEAKKEEEKVEVEEVQKEEIKEKESKNKEEEKEKNQETEKPEENVENLEKEEVKEEKKDEKIVEEKAKEDPKVEENTESNKEPKTEKQEEKKPEETSKNNEEEK